MRLPPRPLLVGIGILTLLLAGTLGCTAPRVSGEQLQRWARERPEPLLVEVVEEHGSLGGSFWRVDVTVEDVASARSFADAFDEAGQRLGDATVVSWRVGGGTTSLRHGQRPTTEEAWNLADRPLPAQATARRIGIQQFSTAFDYEDVVEYDAVDVVAVGAVAEGLPGHTLTVRGDHERLGPAEPDEVNRRAASLAEVAGSGPTFTVFDEEVRVGSADDVVALAERLPEAPNWWVTSDNLVGVSTERGARPYYPVVAELLARGSEVVTATLTAGELRVGFADCAAAAAFLGEPLSGPVPLGLGCTASASGQRNAGGLWLAGSQEQVLTWFPRAREAVAEHGVTRLDVAPQAIDARVPAQVDAWPDALRAVRRIGWQGDAAIRLEVVGGGAASFWSSADGRASGEEHSGTSDAQASRLRAAWDATSP